MPSPAGKSRHFLDLHRPGQPLLLPNPWDSGTAKILASLGFQALATTSSGFAATLGRADGSVKTTGQGRLRLPRRCGRGTKGRRRRLRLAQGGCCAPPSGNNTVWFRQGPADKLYAVRGYPAGKGYDLVTGVGTINARYFVYELACRRLRKAHRLSHSDFGIVQTAGASPHGNMDANSRRA